MAVNRFFSPSWILVALLGVALPAAVCSAQPSSRFGFHGPRWSVQNRTPEGERLSAPVLDPAGGCYCATRSGVVTLQFTSSGGTTWSGAGFLIGSKGVVVTNYHLIEGATEGQAALAGQSRKIDGVLAYDKGQDLALLKIDVAGLSISSLVLAPAAPPLKSPVTAVGGPESFADAINDGEITAAESGEEVRKRATQLYAVPSITATSAWLVLTAPVSPGNSGGPLVNADGAVVGVLTWSRATYGKFNRAAPVSALRRLISSAQVEPAPLKTIAARESAAKPSADAPTAAEFDGGWMGLHHFKRDDLSDSVTGVAPSLRCPRCTGKGTITQTRYVHRFYGEIQDLTPDTVPCPECRGAGLKWGDTTSGALAAMVNRILLADRKTIPAADYTRLLGVATEAFRAAALDDLPDGQKANETLEKPLKNLRAARCSPVVFYSSVGAELPCGSGGNVYSARTFSVDSAILLHGPGLTLRVGRSYLIGGFWAGKVTIPVEGGAASGPGVEVLWAEPLH